MVGVGALAFLLISETQVARLFEGDVAPRIPVGGAACAVSSPWTLLPLSN
jgi:hypothetical protein